MNAVASSCFICRGTEFDRLTPHYDRCKACGHETLAVSDTQTFMLNEPLDPAIVRRDSFLDGFQGAQLDRFLLGGNRRRWVDIGSGSGRLLLRQHRKFEHACGLEVTSAAIAFSRDTLGLSVVSDHREVPGPIDAATAWHSLEHFPAPALESLLAGLAAKMPAGARFIVSVPNGASWQYRLFRRHYAFFDAPNHLQQFTPESLDRLLQANGFKCIATVVSWPYNVFGYAQSLLNLVMPGHNYVYYRLKRRVPDRSLALDLAGLVLLPLAVPLAAMLGVIDAVFPARQGALTCCFERGP